MKGGGGEDPQMKSDSDMRCNLQTVQTRCQSNEWFVYEYIQWPLLTTGELLFGCSMSAYSRPYTQHQHQEPFRLMGSLRR